MKKSRLSWVPNALSLGNLSFGFVSMLISIESTKSSNPGGVFILAGIFIILAAVFDGFDGIIARALNATSDLGAELDTLADLTTFGIAPGVLMYEMILFNFRSGLPGFEQEFPFGMMIAAIFPICAAYRLARFTVGHDPAYFDGLPSPIAGVLVALFPMTFYSMNVPAYITIPTFVCIALLMVSKIRYSKPQVAMRGKLTRGKLMILLSGLLAIFILAGLNRFPMVLYAIILFYVFTGIVSFLIHLIQEI
ncbi:MAG: CDP-alcohol phosphatidyltransferase family protein [Leptospiraceae bacterium]|nr:CDP-alcohol phosphatidyltransferase family protein [Leptospiraceae bacterium]MCP5500901.1 CDP-alcohol phosphatidyltransferase family protein [Leptospiraceae bacterium]